MHSTESFAYDNDYVTNIDYPSLPGNRTRPAPRLRGACLGLTGLLLVLPVTMRAQPQAGIIEHPLPAILSHPDGITTGPDGALWFTEFSGNRIGTMTTAGVLTEFPTPGIVPEVITAAPDGALWFTEFDGDKIARITTAGVITEYPIANASSHSGITQGPDGALWFTETYTSTIGRVTMAGGYSEFALPAESFPQGITAGPDDALWFTEYSTNKIGRISVAGILSEYSIPTANCAPTAIAAGPDGALWFTEYAGNKIGRITTAGVFTEYTVPTPFSLPGGITKGPDGALWFTEYDGNRIGRITTAGAIAEYPIPTARSSPWAITKGPDGALWYTAYDGNRIGQVVIPNAQLTANPDIGAPGASVTFAGSGFAPNESVNLYVNSTGMNLAYTGTTDATGALLLPGRVFAAPYGYNAVVAVGQNSGALGFTPFTIQPRLTLAPRTVTAGSTVTAHGFGFAAGERVEVYWQKPRRLLGEVTVDGLGSFAQGNPLLLTVPGTASAGKNLLYAIGQSSGATVYSSVTVE